MMTNIDRLDNTQHLLYELEAISNPPLRPNLCVGSRRPILEIAYYYCGCTPRPALILNLIEGFEMASNNVLSLTAFDMVI